MKKIMLKALLAVIATTTCSTAEDDIYPLDIQMSVYPKEIKYGDACFVRFQVTNQGEETLLLPYGKKFLHKMSGRLYHEETELQFFGNFDPIEGVLARPAISYTFPGYPVQPGETMKFHIRMIWIPLPEFTHRDQAMELRRLIRRGETDFTIAFYGSYRSSYRRTVLFDQRDWTLPKEKWPLNALSAEDLEAKGYRLEPKDEYWEKYRIPKCSIRVLPRSEEEFKLLQEWYLELPTAASVNQWTMEHVFAHPYHVRNSPYKMEAPTTFELGKKRELLMTDYNNFFCSMETRTPELLARINRTNELAAKIIERSKEPDSTISQNMIEFIQLRCLLVNMRYAENIEAEEAAFEKLMDFVDQSQDKELWAPFFYEVGLYSIMNHTYFPPEKVEKYRERFAERFHINKLGLPE